MSTTPPPQPQDFWAREIQRIADTLPEGQPRLPGKILSVKFGYNPNSSSIGSVVSLLLWSATFGALAINVIASLLQTQRALPEGEPASHEGEA